MRFVSKYHERGSFYCYETVDIGAWQRTLQWCRGMTSGRQCSQAAGNVRIFNITCTRRLMAWLAMQQCQTKLPQTLWTRQWRAGHLWLKIATLTAQYRWRQVGAQTGGRKTSWAKDVWANYFLGDRRLGDKLGWYGDSKSDGWATFSDGWAKCVKEEKLKTSDTVI